MAVASAAPRSGMRTDRGFLVTLLTVLAVLVLGYVAYTISAGVHPGPAPAPSGRLPGHDV